MPKKTVAKKTAIKKKTAVKKGKTERILLKISELKEHPRNYNDHPEDQIAHIIESIKQNGIYRDIVIAKDNTILAGHGVVVAAKKIGITSVYCTRVSFSPNSAKALKILVGDNEISHLGMKDDRDLTEILKEINTIDSEGLLGTGYDEMMLANLLYVTRPASEIADFDAAAEWVGLPEYEEEEEIFTINVRCRSEFFRDEFMKKNKMKKTIKKSGNVITVYYPEEGRDDSASVKFDA